MKENRYTLPEDKGSAFVSETEATYARNASVSLPTDDVDEFDQNCIGWGNMPIVGPKSLPDAYARIEQAEEDYKKGDCLDVDDFEQKIKEKYPWLA